MQNTATLRAAKTSGKVDLPERGSSSSDSFLKKKESRVQQTARCRWLCCFTRCRTNTKETGQVKSQLIPLKSIESSPENSTSTSKEQEKTNSVEFKNAMVRKKGDFNSHLYFKDYELQEVEVLLHKKRAIGQLICKSSQIVHDSSDRKLRPTFAAGDLEVNQGCNLILSLVEHNNLSEIPEKSRAKDASKPVKQTLSEADTNVSITSHCSLKRSQTSAVTGPGDNSRNNKDTEITSVGNHDKIAGIQKCQKKSSFSKTLPQNNRRSNSTASLNLELAHSPPIAYRRAFSERRRLPFLPSSDIRQPAKKKLLMKVAFVDIGEALNRSVKF